ncbi:cell surface glycoprotein [Chroococcidiopsis sp. CCNUC1]|uniref:cell surface glycoprotein n=1 Tax=Chroococcidiopsis sp. CCNUC1 TaxID=2653189 RepID=UPI002021DE83|nr:cell surface glycoprotein [Chroococcidiopsis sp. CCNUC1]URD53179.1 cell surface glycoprotein [Chroococcidiopsis sp. CCNUC1]
MWGQGRQGRQGGTRSSPRPKGVGIRGRRGTRKQVSFVCRWEGGLQVQQPPITHYPLPITNY